MSFVVALASSVMSFGQIKTDTKTDITDKGFTLIFDGHTFDNWVGDSVYWSIQDGVLKGTVTFETLLKENSFIIWQGGQPENFELKMEYRVSAEGNSGISYRSIPYTETNNKYALKGCQLDIDGEGRWTGQNYEEKGREFLALRGETVIKRTGDKPEVVARLDNNGELLNSVNKTGWNEAHIIVYGNTMIHIINGKVMSVVVDSDEEYRIRKGLIGMQVHVGPPMTIEFRNIRLKELN